LSVATEASETASALSFHVNESVQVWYHNGWRDALVTARVSPAELVRERAEEGGDAREYRIRFIQFEPPEGSPQRGHAMLLMFGGTIQMVPQEDADDHPDTQEHEVSAHILRPKPIHTAEYRSGERVQSRP